MKKKLAGLLAALLVLSMGTTVFASQSPTSQETAEQKAQQLRDSVSNVSSSQEGMKVEVGKVDANVVADANEKAAGYSNEAEVLGMVELKSDKDFSKGVTLTFYVAGVKKGDNVRILHKLSDGTWEVIVPYVGDGYVRATFYSLSPIAIVKYPENVSVPSTQKVTENSEESSDDSKDTSKSTSDSNNSNSNSNANDSKSDSNSSSSSSSKSNSNSSAKVNVNINNNNNNDNNSSSSNGNGNRPTSGGSGAATSPKTGQEVPVLPIVAVFTILGCATIYSKKVKSL